MLHRGSTEDVVQFRGIQPQVQGRCGIGVTWRPESRLDSERSGRYTGPEGRSRDLRGPGTYGKGMMDGSGSCVEGTTEGTAPKYTNGSRVVIGSSRTS